MLLSEALEGITVLNEYWDTEIESVTANSREVTKNSLFCAITGRSFDGCLYGKEAAEKGAAAVLSEKELSLPNVVLVEDARSAYSRICKNFYKKSADRMKLCAVTGTNGKTSVATIISGILQNANINAGLISTIKASFNGRELTLDKTTPEPKTLHSLFYEMEQSGVQAVIMEASSQALHQKRLDGINFEVAIFTNLTEDHLDYHRDMAEYFEAKKSLFNMAKRAVINIDDDYGRRLASNCPAAYKTYSIFDDTADFFADDIVTKKDGVSFSLKHEGTISRVNFKIPGLYAVSNALAAIGCCFTLGMSIETITDGLGKIEGIKGRNEVVSGRSGVSVIIDYAHTPDGLKKILESTRKYHKGRLTAVFGCGGERDKEKRPQMGKIASELCDRVIITTDNPRREEPKKIIEDILKGVLKESDFIAFLDRKDAIRYAVMTAKKDEIIIVAGKGHELYQILGDKKIYFDERRLIEGILKRTEKGE